MKNIIQQSLVILCIAICLISSAGVSIAWAASSPKTEVKVLHGVPRILINGQDKITFVNRVDYVIFPGTSYYRDGTWLKGIKRQMDEMKNNGANTLVLDIFWPDLDASPNRPTNLAAVLDFSPLDAAMAYANEKGIYVMIEPKIDTFLPMWWQKENGFPEAVMRPQNDVCIPQEKGADHACIPREICASGDSRCCKQSTQELSCCQLERSGRGVIIDQNGLPKCQAVNRTTSYSACKECETDSYGWKYNVPGMGGEVFRKDYTEYVSAIVNRYKNDPALIGWIFSIGTSGEDQYGPDYIILFFEIYGAWKELAKHPDQVVDYSEHAQAMFRSWMKTRYVSDAQLQSAWEDPTVTLAAVRLPDPRKLFKEGRMGPFPDDFFTDLRVSLKDLSVQGRDLYDFRERVRNNYRTYFTKLIKDLDGKHVLGSFAANNAAVYGNPYIDFLMNANHLEYSVNGYEETNLIAILGELANKHGKANIFVLESTGVNGVGMSGSNPDQDKQKDVLLYAFKTIKCLGNYLGYTTSILETDPMPYWRKKDMEVLNAIGAYMPGKQCMCDLVPPNAKVLGNHTFRELVQTFSLRDRYQCIEDGTTQPNLPSRDAKSIGGSVGMDQEQKNCMDTCTHRYHDPMKCSQECHVTLPDLGQMSGGEGSRPEPGSGQGGRGRCGDGICDEFEKAHSGVCPQDCGRNESQ